MPALLLAGPASEPLTLAEAKAYLRVDHDAEDALITSMITAARASVETLTRRALIDQTWRIVRDAWPASGLIPVPVSPLRTLDRVVRLDAAGTETELPLDAFALDTARLPGLIRVERGRVPAPERPLAGLALDITAGHGPAAADLPAPLIEAVRPGAAPFLRSPARSGGASSRTAQRRPHRAATQ